MTNKTAGIGDNNPPSNTELLREKHKPIFDRLKTWEKEAKKVAALVPQSEADCIKLEKVYRDGKDLANDADGIRVVEKKPHQDAANEVDEVFNKGVRDVVGAVANKPGTANELLQRAADWRLAEAKKESERLAKEAERLAEQEARSRAAAERAEARGDHRNADLHANKAETAAEAADRAAISAQRDIGEISRSTAGGLTARVKGTFTCDGIKRAELDLETLRNFIDQKALIAAVDAYLKATGEKTLKGAAITEKAKGSIRR